MWWRYYPALAALAAALGAQTGSPDVVIRSSSNEVLLDVAVRNAHGRLVTNLKPGEVAVYEDGVRQQVSSFRLVAGREVRVEDLKQAVEARAAGTPAGNSARPAVNPLRTVNIVCLILNDLDADTRAYAFDSARKFVNNELRPNTFIGVFTLDSSGLRPVFPFSNNRERLLQAVQLAAMDQLPTVNLDSAAMMNGLSMTLLGSVASGASTTGNADGSNVAHPLGVRGEMGLSVNAALRELDALQGLVRQLDSLPFQKTVLLLSTGLTRPPDLLEYWDSLIHSANRGGVTFYAMDVYELGVCQGDSDPDCVAHSALAPSAGMLNAAAALSAQQARSGQLALPTSPSGPAPSSTAQLMEDAHEDDYVRFGVSSSNRQEGLRDLAERTGGFLIANTNNIGPLMARVMEDVDTHYEIAYPPTSNNYDGHFRKIEVKLTRPGLTVQTRNGYFAVPETGEAGPVTPEEMAGLKALDTQPRPHDFDFLLRAYRFRDQGGTGQYAVAFEMPISNLTATPEPRTGKHLLHASLLALVKNAQGQIVDRVSRDVPSEVGDGSLAAVQVETMTWEHAVNLPPGQYTVEAAVVDQQGNRAGTGVARIDNRETAGPEISDITLVRRLENLDRPPDPADPFEYPGKRVLPFVSTDMYKGAFPFVYFVVYPDKANPASLELRVRFLRNGRVLAARKAVLPPPDASGSYPRVIAGYARPGSYEVRVTATQGQAAAQQSLRYTIAGP